MTQINFITNQALETKSGGWGGISHGIYSALSRKADVNFIGPIEPPVAMLQKLRSKALRAVGLRGDFFYFSEWRLSKIQEQVSEAAQAADFDFYFGATPWLKCDLKRPYGSYIDALFPTYLRIFGEPSKFGAVDLNRIRMREEAWLRDASHIFWTSHWAKQDGAQFEDVGNVSRSIVGVGGNLDPPLIDSFTGEKRLLFMSMRFLEKGGMETFEAFVRLQSLVADLRLVIIGEPPPDAVAQHPGVEVLGMIDKTKPDEEKRLRNEISRAFCLVHPTRMDTMGCVLIEAAFWGCPSIAPSRFGIPEIIQDKVTGLLLPEPFTVDDIVSSISTLLDDKVVYLEMRRAARSRALALFTYDAIADKILAKVEAVLSG